MQTLSFVKMQATGNDFIILNDLQDSLSQSFSEISRKIADRKFGVGADQVLFLKPSQNQDYRMVVFNADGSEGEMSGNGMRCFAKYLFDKSLVNKPQMTIETLAGTIQPEVLLPNHSLLSSQIKVFMGKPDYQGRHQLKHPEFKNWSKDNLKESDDLSHDAIWVHKISMGNPHAVVFVKNVDAVDLEKWGPIVENHPDFPQRTNFEIVSFKKEKIHQRTWERGAKETLACGTGACAVATAIQSLKLSFAKGTIHLRGGDIDVCFDQERDGIYQAGPACLVFSGEWSVV